MRYKVAIRFAIEGDLRFISHHDTMRLFERALARTQLPVRYSEGFNPRPRLSLPVPRAVAVATEDDVLVVELTEPVDPNEVVCRLRAQMPPDLTIRKAWTLVPGMALQPEEVEYHLGLPAERELEVAAAATKLLGTPVYQIHRTGPNGKPEKKIDLRSYLENISVEHGSLRWVVRVTSGGTARPTEVLEAVGLDPAAWRHQVRRTKVTFAET